MRRVDGVLLAAKLVDPAFFEGSTRAADARFVSARTGEVVRVASKARLSLSTRVRGKLVGAAKKFYAIGELACKTLGKTAGLLARIKMSSTPRRRDTKEETSLKHLIIPSRATNRRAPSSRSGAPAGRAATAARSRAGTAAYHHPCRPSASS